MFQSSDVDHLMLQARVALSRGQIGDARAWLDRALRLEPENALALAARADVALEQRERADALRFTERALASEPHCGPAWYQHARALWLAARQQEALEAARRAADIQPTNGYRQIQRAQLCAWMGYRQEAEAALAGVLGAPYIDNDVRAAATSALGELAIAAGRFADADAPLQEALRLNPDLPVTRMMLGMNQIRQGNFAAGWTNFAAREQVRQLYPEGPARLPGKPWTGESLKGRRIIVADDQGRGDAIQFARFLPLLRADAVTLLTFPGLVRLFRQSLPGITVVDGLPNDAQADYHCSSTAMLRWLNITLETMPAFQPYLFAPRQAGIRLPAGRQPQVGLAWSGDIAHVRDHLRSIPADLFLTLADIPGLGFHSLQPVVRPGDMAALDRRTGMGRAIETVEDFADTASLIRRLDLVITVDTSVAHLAAAMGKPVWIVLHVSADWRWLIDRPDTPWYPNARLFRVRPDEWGDGDFGWQPVLGRVATALREHFALT